MTLIWLLLLLLFTCDDACHEFAYIGISSSGLSLSLSFILSRPVMYVNIDGEAYEKDQTWTFY